MGGVSLDKADALDRLARFTRENGIPEGYLVDRTTGLIVAMGAGMRGAAVLDSSGNVIGHVATVRPLFDQRGRPADPSEPGHADDRVPGAPLMTFHDAIPARSVLTLLRP